MAIKSIFVVSDQTEALSELCYGAKKLADKVTAIVFGDKAAADAAAAYGADAIRFAPLDNCTPENYSKALAAAVKAEGEATVLLSNTIRGRAIAGMLGAYLDVAVLTNVSALTMEGDKLVAARTVYGGAAIRCESYSTAYSVMTVSGGIFGDVEAPAAATADIAQLEGAAEGMIKCLARNEKKESAVNLAVAKRIVDVGRGLAAEEDLEMMRKLASVLEAEVGCSRPVAENNKWMPKACYMGVTGVVVKPDLCLSIGVSGQVQHIAGIDKSKVIVAINKDKNAPIFKNADFGIVGDLYKVVPALIEKLS